MFRLWFAVSAASGGSAEKNLEQWEPELELLQEESHCTDTPSVSNEVCLKKPGCMWLETDAKNLCVPCSYQGVEIPCVPIGAVYASKKVKQCEMNCPHKKILTKGSQCLEEGPNISNSQCVAKGLSSLTKCMWTQYTDAQGKSKSMCGQCSVPGVGKIPCPDIGMLGPEPGSTVMLCSSMCDQKVVPFHVAPCDNKWEKVPCTRANRTERCKNSECKLIKAADVDCPASAATEECSCLPKERFGPIGLSGLPPVPPMPPSVAMPLRALGIPTAEGAPNYFAVAVQKPFGVKEFTEASKVAAKAAGWGDIPLPPDAAVVAFGHPPPEGPAIPKEIPVAYGQPPPGIPGIAPPNYWGIPIGTPPPPQKAFLQKNDLNANAAFHLRSHRNKQQSTLSK